jgi:hypothetical protein
MVWILRLPFRLGPSQSIEAGDLHLIGLDAQIIVDDDLWRLLVIRGIATEHEARELASRLAGALKWVAIKMGWGIEIREEIQELKDLGEAGATTADIPGRRFWADGHQAVIYSDGQAVGFATARELGVVQSMPPVMASQRLVAALDAGGASPRDVRVRLAVDLFVSSGFELNPYAAFLLRMTTLEVLAERPLIAQAGLDAIEEWIAGIEKFAAKGLSDDFARSLRGSLRVLRKRSISKSVEELVRDAAGADAATRVAELYGLRSRMIHDGIIPGQGLLGMELQDLTGIVRRVLLNRMRALA